MAARRARAPQQHDPAELAVQESLRRAQQIWSSGLGTTLVELKAADQRLSDKLAAIVARHGGPTGRFTESSAILYRKQIGLVTDYLEKRLAGHTHTRALAAIRIGVRQTVSLARTFEARHRGITLPIPLGSVQMQDATVRGVGASLLQRHRASFARYGKATVADFERVLRGAQLEGLTHHQTVSRLVEAGKLGGHTARTLHENEPGHFPEPTSYVKRRYWAERIVRTETAHALGAAALQAMNVSRQTEFPDLKKKILATFDNRTAPDSVAVHGQVRKLEEYFMDGAGRTYLHPPGRPNDREVVIPWRDHWEEVPATEPPTPEVQEEAKQEATGAAEDQATRRQRLGERLAATKARLEERKRIQQQAALADQANRPPVPPSGKAKGGVKLHTDAELPKEKSTAVEIDARAVAKAQAAAKREARAAAAAERVRQRTEAKERVLAERAQRKVAREAERTAPPKPLTRGEAIKEMQGWAENVHFGPDRDPVHIHKLLADQDAALLWKGRKIGHIELSARATAGHWTELEPGQIPLEAGGQFADPTLHRGHSFLKVANHQHNDTPEEAAETKANVERVQQELLAEGFKSTPEVGKSADGRMPYMINHPEYQRVDQVLTHEFGHAVHMSTFGPYQEIDQVVHSRFLALDREAVSRYAEENRFEYFAETYAAYRMRGAELLQVAPKAHKMVEDVLRLRGMRVRK